jgi:hypothetical protein
MLGEFGQGPFVPKHERVPVFYVMHLAKVCNEKRAKLEETNIMQRVAKIVKRML